MHRYQDVMKNTMHRLKINKDSLIIAKSDKNHAVTIAFAHFQNRTRIIQNC